MDEPKVMSREMIECMIRWLDKQRQDELSVSERDKIDCKIMTLRWVLWEATDADLLERSF